jgi:hypothetical protein
MRNRKTLTNFFAKVRPMMANRLRININALRVERDIPTLLALCRAAGVTQSVLYRFMEQQSDTLNFSACDALARFFRVDVSELFASGGTRDWQTSYHRALAGIVNQVQERDAAVLYATAKAMTSEGDSNANQVSQKSKNTTGDLP